MADSHPIEQYPIEDEYTVEITDLEPANYARNDLTSWLTHMILDWQHSPNRKTWQYTGIVCVLVLLISIVSINTALPLLIINSVRSVLAPQHSNMQTHVPPLLAAETRRFNQQDGLSCLVDAAWSPDGTSIAILGYTQTCSQSNFVPAQVNIYDAHTGKLIAHWIPDYSVTRTLYATEFFSARLRVIIERNTPPGSNGGFVSMSRIYYSHILWSPDGQRLALTFTASTRLHNFGGVLLIGSNGNLAQVFIQRQYGTDPLYSEWNLRSGVPLKSHPASAALSYIWGAGGALLSKTLLKDHTVIEAPQSGAIGNPDGGNSFTIWQPGLAIIISRAHSPSVYVWKTSVTAWSPDGNYLVEGFDLKAIIEPSGHPFPNSGILNDLHMNNAPLLTVHDRALLRATFGSLAIAWRSDGRVLAATNFTGTVDLYDCVTGQKLATLFVPVKHPPISGSPAVLRWSPDGTHLLLSSAQWGIMNIWGPGQLS